jgi:hypothetical protein
MSQNLLKPRTIELENQKTKLMMKQKKSAEYYNRHAKDLPPLEDGDDVKLKPFTLGNKKWANGTVTKRLDERSYEVQSGDALYRRNRVHLKKVLPPTSTMAKAPAEAKSGDAHYYHEYMHGKKVLQPSNMATHPVAVPVPGPDIQQHDCPGIVHHTSPDRSTSQIGPDDPCAQSSGDACRTPDPSH